MRGNNKLIDEHRALVVDSVTISILVTRDATARFLFASGISGLHVGTHLDHIQNAVSVPGHGNGFLDLRLAQDEFKRIAFRQLNRFVRLLNGKETFLINIVSRCGEAL